jgi:hypothetical protein
MSFRAWVFAVTIGLIAGLLQAQEQEQDASGNTANQQAQPDSSPFSIPIRVIEGHESTASRERSEADAEQREKDDLLAQQGMNTATQAMNKATQSMKRAAWWSVGIVAFGTLLLVWTLCLTRRANEAAQDAVKATREIGEAQVRAYLSTTHVQVGHNRPNGNLSFTCDILNSGQSPARDAYALVKITLFVNDTTVDFRCFHEIGDISVGRNEGTSISYTDLKISGAEFAASQACHVQILIKARDVFKVGIDYPAFFATRGLPMLDDGYTLKPFLNIHDRLGLGIEERDFADIIPNWRKESHS